MILTVTSRDPGPAFKKFYINRLIRTIPLYYLVLLALWFITSQRPPLSCFLFLQNFSGEDLGYFPPSWSLPVEAWFYFLIPPVFFLLYRLFSRKHRYLLISVTGMAALYGWYLADLWGYFDNSNLGRILFLHWSPCCAAFWFPTCTEKAPGNLPGEGNQPCCQLSGLSPD